MFTSLTLLEFTGLLGAITLVAILSNLVRLPTIVAFILGGLAVGPYGLKLIKSPPDANLMAEIVAIFLMFTIGLEFSFSKLRTLKREFFNLGMFQVVLTVVCVALLANLFVVDSFKKSLFFGFLVALSSTALVLKLLYQHRELETPYGRNILGILLFQDVAVIPMMLLLPLLAGESAGMTKDPRLVLDWLVKAGVIVLGIFVTSRYLIPSFIERVARTGSREVFFFFVLFLCLGAASLFHELGMSFSLGAFVAGVLISESPYGRQATSDILPLLDNFLGLLFATIGMLLDPSFLVNNLGTVLSLGSILFFIKAFLVFGICVAWKIPKKFAVITGLSVCQIGEFSFVLAAQGMSLNLLTEIEYQYFLSASILSMVFTPFLFMIAPKLALTPGDRWRSLAATRNFSKLLRDLPVKKEAINQAAENPSAGHAILIGFGVANQNLASAFESLALPYRIVEANYETVMTYQKKGVPIEFGDATSAEVLKHAGIESANLVVVAITGSKVIPTIIDSVRRLRPDVSVLVRAQYIREVDALKSFNGIEVVVAEIETAVELLARSLHRYGVDPEDIHQNMTEVKGQLLAFSNITSHLKRPVLNLPSWQALGSIRPFRIGSNFSCIDKALHELSLPRRTGATVVTIYREGVGMKIADGEFVLKEGDVVHLAGTPESLVVAEKELKSRQH